MFKWIIIGSVFYMVMLIILIYFNYCCHYNEEELKELNEKDFKEGGFYNGKQI